MPDNPTTPQPAAQGAPAPQPEPTIRGVLHAKWQKLRRQRRRNSDQQSEPGRLRLYLSEIQWGKYVAFLVLVTAVALVSATAVWYGWAVSLPSFLTGAAMTAMLAIYGWAIFAASRPWQRLVVVGITALLSPYVVLHWNSIGRNLQDFGLGTLALLLVVVAVGVLGLWITHDSWGFDPDEPSQAPATSAQTPEQTQTDTNPTVSGPVVPGPTQNPDPTN